MLIAYATRAPEQFTNPTKREPKSDVYALGCILYYLLTRRLPYQATTPEELVRCHRKAAVPNIQQECPTIPNTVANLITRMLAKKPEDRLTAAEVAFYLENSLPAQDSGRFEFGAQPQMSGPLSFVGHQLSGLTAQASVPLPDHAMIDEDVEVIHESQFDGENTKRMSDHTPVSVNPRKARSKRRKSQRKGIHPLALFTLVITVGLITFLVLFKMVKFLGG